MTSITKLHDFIQKFQWTGEKGDVWQTPEEFLKNEHLDCDDFMRFNVDVLKRVMGIEARGVIQSGYDKKRWGNKIWNIKCHAICIFPFEGKLAVFSNRGLRMGVKSYEEAGHYFFPDGLKYMEIRNWKGKVLKRKFKIFGIF